MTEFEKYARLPLLIDVSPTGFQAAHRENKHESVISKETDGSTL